MKNKNTTVMHNAAHKNASRNLAYKRTAFHAFFVALFSVFFALLPPALFAESDIPAIQKSLYENPLDSDDTAFAEIARAFSSSAMAADYTQTKTVARLDRTLVSSGKMLVLPEAGIAWLTEKPYASTMVVGRDSIKQRIGARVTKLDVSQNRIYLSMAEALESVFTGNFSRIEETFDTFFVAGTGAREGKCFLGLIPKEDAVKAFVQSITIEGSDTVDAVLMTERSGDTTLYALSNIEQRELRADEKQNFAF